MAGPGAGPAEYEANKKSYAKYGVEKRLIHAEDVGTELQYPKSGSGFPECMEGVQYTDQMRYSILDKIARTCFL